MLRKWRRAFTEFCEVGGSNQSPDIFLAVSRWSYNRLNSVASTLLSGKYWGQRQSTYSTVSSAAQTLQRVLVALQMRWVEAFVRAYPSQKRKIDYSRDSPNGRWIWSMGPGCAGGDARNSLYSIVLNVFIRAITIGRLGNSPLGIYVEGEGEGTEYLRWNKRIEIGLRNTKQVKL